MTTLCLASTILMSSGHRIPIFGFGATQVSSREDGRKAIATSIECGIRLIDASPLSRTEEITGEVLQEFLNSGKVKREDFFICTKLPWNGMRPESVEYFCKKSLEKLHLDYLDLYLVDFPVSIKRTDNDEEYISMKEDGFADTDYVDLIQNWKAMESLVETGLVKSIGLANYNSKQVQRVYDMANIKPAVLQVECHPHLTQVELFDLCQKLNITFSASSPLGAPTEKNMKTEEEGEFCMHKFDYDAPRLLNHPKLLPIAQMHKKTVGQVLLRFAVQRGMVVVPMFAHSYEIAAHRSIFDFNLDEKELRVLHSFNTNNRFMRFNLWKGIVEHPEYPFKTPF